MHQWWFPSKKDYAGGFGGKISTRNLWTLRLRFAERSHML